MEKYNLDDKGRLFKFVEKRPGKVIKVGDRIELKHFCNPAFLVSSVLEVGESTIKVEVKDKVSDFSISSGDPVILNYKPSGEIFVVTGEIASQDKIDPIQTTIDIHKIEKMKDLIKEKKYGVCFPAQIKIIGIPETRFAAVKNLSFGGIKANCKENIMMEDVVDVTIQLDKAVKMNFKGRIVRKNKLNDVFDYGIEFTEMTETNNKQLTRCMYGFESML